MALITIEASHITPAGERTTIPIHAEPVSTHFAVAPVIFLEEDGTPSFYGDTAPTGVCLMHIPSRCVVAHDSYNLRELARQLEAIDDIDWANLSPSTSLPREQHARIREVFIGARRAQVDLKWPGWRSAPVDPVNSLMRVVLDGAHLRGHTTAAADRVLVERVGDLDRETGAELERRLHDAGTDAAVAAFQLAYLLNAFARVDPESAAHAALHVREVGDAASVEGFQQIQDQITDWLQEFSRGIPLTLPGFPALHQTVVAPAGELAR